MVREDHKVVTEVFLWNNEWLSTLHALRKKGPVAVVVAVVAVVVVTSCPRSQSRSSGSTEKTKEHLVYCGRPSKGQRTQ